MNTLTGACPACPDTFLLAEASQLPQTISPVPDYPYTIRKTVLRSIWLLLAVKPLFLPWMEEEMIPTLYAAAFCISKGDRCVSFALHLFTLGLTALIHLIFTRGMYLLDLPSLLFGLCLAHLYMQAKKWLQDARWTLMPSEKTGGMTLCLAHAPLSNIRCFHVGVTVPFSSGLLRARFPFILQLLMKILSKCNHVDPHKFTTNTHDAVFVTDFWAQSKPSFLTS